MDENYPLQIMQTHPHQCFRNIFRLLHLLTFYNARVELAYTDTLRVPTVSSTMRPSKR